MKYQSQFAILPVVIQFVKRVVDTRSQAELTDNHKRKNVSDSFKIADDLPYQIIALIDNEITT